MLKVQRSSMAAIGNLNEFVKYQMGKGFESGGGTGAAGTAAEIMVIGGADLFRLFLPRADRVHLTRVHGDIDGDIRWDPLDETRWRRTAAEHHSADERHAYAMTFELWEKR